MLVIRLKGCCWWTFRYGIRSRNLRSVSQNGSQGFSVARNHASLLFSSRHTIREGWRAGNSNASMVHVCFDTRWRYESVRCMCDVLRSHDTSGDRFVGGAVRIHTYYSLSQCTHTINITGTEVTTSSTAKEVMMMMMTTRSQQLSWVYVLMVVICTNPLRLHFSHIILVVMRWRTFGVLYRISLHFRSSFGTLHWTSS